MIVQGYVYSYNTAIKKLKEAGLDKFITEEENHTHSILGTNRKWWDHLRHTNYIIEDYEFIRDDCYSINAFGRKSMYIIPKCCVKVIERK